MDEFPNDDLDLTADDQPPSMEEATAFVEAPHFQEYQTSGEEFWRVDAWEMLGKDFGITLADLSAWHDAFSGEGRPWLILRRYYHVACMFGGVSVDEVEDRRWSFRDIGKDLGISEAIIIKEYESALKFWKEKKSAVKFQASMKAARKDDAQESGEVVSDEDQTLNLYSDIEEKEITSILKQLNLDHIKDLSQRLDIADRALALKPFLEDKNQRTTALRIIGMEVTMHSYQSIIININNSIQDLMTEEDTKSQKQLADLETRLRLTQKALEETVSKHAKLVDFLGASDIDTAKKKRQFTGAISSMIEMRRAYYEDPENALADGMATFQEIDWMINPQGPRPAQYRPDISFAVWVSMMEENFYNPEFDGDKTINREKTRKMLKMVAHMAAGEPETDGTIEGVDDISLDDDGDANAAIPSPEIDLTINDATAPPTGPAPANFPTSRNEDVCVVS